MESLDHLWLRFGVDQRRQHPPDDLVVGVVIDVLSHLLLGSHDLLQLVRFFFHNGLDSWICEFHPTVCQLHAIDELRASFAADRCMILLLEVLHDLVLVLLR